MEFSTIDIIIFVAYCLLIVGIGLWVSREKKGHEKNSSDYFLASKSLPWWAIGTSLIASNISAEQFIGMSGSGYAIGLGIATYEWMAAITLLVVAKWFLPVFLEKGIYTMPQFLEIRFDSRVRTSMAIFWILVYIFVNLTAVLYLGALALQTIMGIDLLYGIIGLAIFSAAYTIYGGLKAVAWTDVVQVVFLIAGGLLTTYLALDAVGGGEGVIAGFGSLVERAPEKFDMILSPDHPAYEFLPGISVLIGGMWIANLSYWGFNQYIIQRALAAENLSEAQRGLAFAGFLKILMPLIVVVPGIAAFVLDADIQKSDEAYPWLLNTFVFTGAKGLAFAALIAAVVSSLSSMTNSTATIFTMDIYRSYINKGAPERQLVYVGRIVSAVALFIAVLVAPQLATLDQAFQFIQEFTGFISPGIVAIFLLGLFWKKATANGALWAAVLSIPLSFLLKFMSEGFIVDFSSMYLDFVTINFEPVTAIPFLDRMMIVFVVLCAIMIAISLYERRGADNPKGIKIEKSLFHTGTVFNVSAIAICGIVAVLYALFW
jgi:SSS family solute:Na+ symporter